MRAIRWATAAVAVVVMGMGAEALAAQDRGAREVEARVALEAARMSLTLAGPELAEARARMSAVAPELAEQRARLGEQRSHLSGQGIRLGEQRMRLTAQRMRFDARGMRSQSREPARAEQEVLRERRQVRPALPRLGSDDDRTPPEGWLQEDPGARVYQAAREALNRRRYDEAARLFAEIRDEHPRSGYVPDSYYWQAFALYREGGQNEYRRALELLKVQQERHADASTAADARSLMVRVEAQLARGGDAAAAEEITRRASSPCGEEQEVRMAALSALMNMNADQAVPILEEVLQSRGECSVELRRRAVFLIAQHQSDASVEILLDLAHRNPDPDREVREQAVFWLHQVDTPEALDALESILMESDDEEIQERAIFSISQRSDARSGRILQDYAERTDVPTELRENAIFWISQSPAAGGAAFLMDLYDRLDDPDLKERAIFGVAQTNSAEGRTWLIDIARDRRETVDVRKNALFWAGQMGGLQASELRGLYDTLDDIEMKEQVIFVASQMRGSEAVDFLMEVASNERDQELRKKAIFWLGQSKDPRVAEFLLTLIGAGAVAR